VPASKLLPVGVRFTPDQKTALVALGRANHVAIIDRASRRVTALVPVGMRVWHLAISADGSRAYAANGLSDTVSVIDIPSAKVVATVPTGRAPWGVVVAP
jgi:YVTN family beta-propeller protein